MGIRSALFIRPALFSRPALFTVAAALVLGLSGCGTSEDSPGVIGDASQPSAPSVTTSPGTETPSADITIKNFAFAVAGPVAPGARVTIQNGDSQSHTVTSIQPGVFGVTIGGGVTSTLTAPKKPGSYRFLCTFHPQMKGVLVVR
jgi:plastocyanin